MKTSLSHLPQIKQEQILQIVEIIKEVASPEKIILFGSYAKGNFVEHRYTGRDGILYEYISDYDFLVVTKKNNIKEYELDDIVMSRTQQYKPPINLQIHEIDYINEGLDFGQYFFADIIKEGILLYETDEVQFAMPRILSSKELIEISERYFNLWFNRATEFLIDGNHAYHRNSFNKAAFELHQAAESLYYTVLLVFTGYKPKTHNLQKLRKYAKHLSEDLFLVFPIETSKEEKKLFDLLKHGYIDARYKDDYLITKKEALLLITRLNQMKEIVERICKEKIEFLNSKI